jgi:cellulase
MECAQINVVGGTGTAKPQTYSIPGIYKANDPGILINIYSMSPSSQYTIPGPPKFTCGSSGGGSNPATTSKPPSQTTTLVTSVAPPTTTSSPGNGGCSVSQWGQCGGTNYNGCTTCASPYSCKVINAYYSQCT